MQSIFKRLHRIEDLTICNWAGVFQNYLQKYQTRNAPRLRRLAVDNSTSFCAYSNIVDGDFPFILSQLCPRLSVLILNRFALTNIRPALLPVLKELYFCAESGARISVTDFLPILEGLPQLETLSVSLSMPSIHESPVRQRAVVLPQLRKLVLAGIATMLTHHLELPAIIHISLNLTITIKPHQYHTIKIIKMIWAYLAQVGMGMYI